MKKLKLKQKLPLAMHTFQVFHPTQAVPYPDAQLVAFCTGINASKEDLGKFPHNARLSIDGQFVGQLVNVFDE